MDRVPVVIVGGGPVGLVAALELARYGIRSLVVERHDSTRWHSKARNLNARTMEIARGWGRTVHDELAAVNLPRPWTGHIIYTRTLAGEELGRMPTAGFTGPGPGLQARSSAALLAGRLRTDSLTSSGSFAERGIELHLTSRR